MDLSGGAFWIVDDTGFPKQGTHSVGVARQYCGVLGKQDNCQVAVSISLANAQASVPVAYRLYLPKAWAEDAQRRRQAGIPLEVNFATKTQIALEQLETLLAEGAPRYCVLADAGYEFLVAERLDADKPLGAEKTSSSAKCLPLPADYVPRESPARATPRVELDRHPAPRTGLPSDRQARSTKSKSSKRSKTFVT